MFQRVALPIAVRILLCLILLHKREQVIIDCSILYALLDFMKKTFLIAALSCWNLLPPAIVNAIAPFIVPNAFLSSVDLSTSSVVIIFNLP